MLALASARPQFDANSMSDQDQILNELFPSQNADQPTTTQATAQTPNNPSSTAYLNCTRNQCMTTNEYNPVCGTDENQYINIRKMDCANRCGQRLFQNWQGRFYPSNHYRTFIAILIVKNVFFLSFPLNFLAPYVTVVEVLRVGGCVSGSRVP